MTGCHVLLHDGRRPARCAAVRVASWLAVALLAGCGSTPQRSSYACMRAVRGELPAGLPDARAHCLASALIARRCSPIEAQLAGLGKEFSDLFTRGDASWSDWRADRAGVACASSGLADLDACCARRGY